MTDLDRTFVVFGRANVGDPRTRPTASALIRGWKRAVGRERLFASLGVLVNEATAFVLTVRARPRFSEKCLRLWTPLSQRLPFAHTHTAVGHGEASSPYGSLFSLTRGG